MKKKLVRPLRLTPYAWAKLLFLRDLGPTEVGGFGVSAAKDLLLVEDVQLIRQICTEVSVKFDDTAVADYFDRQVDGGLLPERFGRVWLHTHPDECAIPSHKDEETFQRCFGSAAWAIMFILARGGATYARLRFCAGPGGQIELPVEVDFTQPFPAADPVGWEAEYARSVVAEQLLPVLPVKLNTSYASDDPWAGYDPRLDGLYDRHTDEPFPDPFLEPVDGRYF
jgi:hypothetical protein